MRRLRWIVSAVVLVLLVWRGAVWYRSSHAPPQAVFLIIVDTLRPDRLSCYGYDGHVTPNIDAIARRGVRFDNAQSVASWTNPSMGAMMTSLYPTQLGLVEHPGQMKRFKWREPRRQQSYLIPLHERTLAEIMRDAGFETAAFIDQPGLIVGDGFSQGFDEWYQPLDTVRVGLRDPERKYERLKTWRPTLRHSYEIDNGLIDEFEEWLSSRRGEKVFAWLHLLTPHRPYNPPEEFAPAELSGLEGLEAASARYDGEVRAVDRMIGRALAAIEKTIGTKRSLVVFTSDHGEAFGEHGMFEHGHTLHEEVIHIPLIIAGPSLPRGRVCKEYVRSIDIMPTILDITGLDPLIPAQARGASLAPVIEGKGKSRLVYSEAMLYGSTERSLILDGRKLMFDQQGKKYSLYDVVSDPRELVDIRRKEKQRTKRMRARLKAIHTSLLRDYGKRRSGKRGKRDEAEEKRKDAEMMRALRALGYINE